MRRHLKRFLPDHEAIRGNRWLRPFAGSLLHPRLWHLNRHSAAGAVAAGLFCGLIPGPFQMLGSAVCALLFRVNLPLAMATTLYTNPFTIVPLYLAAYQVGRFTLGDDGPFIPPPQPDFLKLQDWSQDLLAWVSGVGEPLLLGLVLLAAGLAAVGYLATHAAWRLHLLLARRRRSKHHEQIMKLRAGRGLSKN